MPDYFEVHEPHIINNPTSRAKYIVNIKTVLFPVSVFIEEAH